MINFVGAGPGAADLITVRGMRLIGEADVLIYAGSLVSKELLSYAKGDCVIYDSSKMNLEEIIEVMRSSENAGLNTVRLHTGDPSLYGAIAEQMNELDKLGIEYDLCPGVSAYQGASASLKMEYTLPGVSQTVILTRISGKTLVKESESLAVLAKAKATIILYLSAGYADRVSKELIQGGYDEETTAAIVYRATWDDELIIKTKLNKLEYEMKKAGVTKHALIIVGDVLDGISEYSKLYDSHFSTEYRKGTGDK